MTTMIFEMYVLWILSLKLIKSECKNRLENYSLKMITIRIQEKNLNQKFWSFYCATKNRNEENSH